MIERRTWSAALVVAILACGGGGESEFAGTWLEAGPGGQEAEWVFGQDGSLSWNVVGQTEGGHQSLRYEVVSTGNPYELDITGFETPPMAGQTLYCIAVFPGEDTMRLDCRPGPPEGGEGNRPDSFGDDALDLTRREGGGAAETG